MIDTAITEALADLERARAACVEAMADRIALPADRVRAASELRHINRDRIALLDRQAEDEAHRRQRAESGCWQA